MPEEFISTLNTSVKIMLSETQQSLLFMQPRISKHCPHKQKLSLLCMHNDMRKHTNEKANDFI